MQRCTNKLYWLDQQAKDRTHYDWSDHNLDYPSRRRQYEVGVCSPTWPCSLGSPGPAPARNFVPREVGVEPGERAGAGSIPCPLPQFPPVRHKAL